MGARQSEIVLERKLPPLPVLRFACALSLLACGGADDKQSGSDLNGSEKTSDSAMQSTPANANNTSSAGAQAGPAKSAGGSAAPTKTSSAAGAGAVPTQAAATAGTAATANAASGAAGSAGDSASAAAGAAGQAAAAGAAGAPSNTGAACDRACLTGFNDSYLDALIAKDASKLKTSASVRFTENGKELKLTEGLWAVASGLGPYRQDMAEVPAGQTAGFVSLQDDRGDVLLAFRLKVENMEVTEIETTVCRSGEATFFSPNALMHNPIYDKEVEPGARMDRDAIIKIVDSYFAGIESSDGSAIPFAETARRNENGANTGSGTGLKNVAMFSYIDKIDRRYVLVDVERGNVLPWVLFQIPSDFTGSSRTLHLAELFKVDGGKIMDVQAIMVNQPFGTPSGWE